MNFCAHTRMTHVKLPATGWAQQGKAWRIGRLRTQRARESKDDHTLDRCQNSQWDVVIGGCSEAPKIERQQDEGGRGQGEEGRQRESKKGREMTEVLILWQVYGNYIKITVCAFLSFIAHKRKAAFKGSIKISRSR